MLNRLLENTRRRVAIQREKMPLNNLVKIIDHNEGTHRPPTLANLMSQKNGISVIAEMKRSSPSKGLLRSDLVPAKMAIAYQQAGAEAISVLTEPSGFGGCEEDLLQVREVVTCPLLRKDFIISSYQVVETAALQADILLLIAAALSNSQLIHLHRMAAEWHLQCLLEIHNQEELYRVLALPLNPAKDYIGINNRNLKTFQVSLETTYLLAPQVPEELMVISESGIGTRDQVEKMQGVGVNGILVGESLVMATDPWEVLHELRGRGNNEICEKNSR